MTGARKWGEESGGARGTLWLQAHPGPPPCRPRARQWSAEPHDRTTPAQQSRALPHWHRTERPQGAMAAADRRPPARRPPQRRPGQAPRAPPPAPLTLMLMFSAAW